MLVEKTNSAKHFVAAVVIHSNEAKHSGSNWGTNSFKLSHYNYKMKSGIEFMMSSRQSSGNLTDGTVGLTINNMVNMYAGIQLNSRLA